MPRYLRVTVPTSESIPVRPAWKPELIYALAALVGSALAGQLLSNDPTVTAACGVLGLALCLAVEWVLWLRAEVRRLQDVEMEVKQMGQQVAQAEHRAAAAGMEAKINAIHLKEWADAYREAAAGHILPPEAILARIQINQKAANVDKPLTPPDLTGGA